jgi:hypothetical protein
MEKWERSVCWTITGAPAIACLKRVVRHLRAKQDQASLLIWLYRDAIRKNERINWTETMEMALWVREQISVLNQKGPTVAPHAEGTWRTSQLNMDQQWDEFSETWPRAGTMRNGKCYQRPPLERPIYENEYGFWPTVTANTAKNTSAGINYKKRAAKAHLDGVIYETFGEPLTNPQWVEWLMGYPKEWSALEDSATPSSRKSRKR